MESLKPRQSTPQRMLRRGSIIGTLLLWTLIAVGVATVHEAGHHLAFSLVGSRLEHAHIFPGLQVYPQVEWFGWDSHLVYTSYSSIPGVAAPDWRFGLCAFAGSGATALAAYLALVILILTNTARGARALTAVAFLGAADILCYSLLPVTGIRYGLPFAGEDAEPYRGAMEMGVTPVVYWTLLAIHALACYGLLVYVWKRKDRTEKRRQTAGGG
jgi:hypothetical protein